MKLRACFVLFYLFDLIDTIFHLLYPPTTPSAFPHRPRKISKLAEVQTQRVTGLESLVVFLVFANRVILFAAF